MNDHRNLNRPGWVRPSVEGQHESNRYDGNGASRLSETQGSTRTGVANQVTGIMRRAWHHIFHLVSSVGHVGLKLGSVVPGLNNLFRGPSTLLKYGVGGLLIAFIASLVCYYMMGWRALPVNFLKSSIEYSLSNNFGGAEVNINQALLQRDTLRGGFIVRLTEMSLKDQNGQLIASSPEMAIGLRTLPLFIGQLEPDSLNLIAPVLHLGRNEKGEWSFWRDDIALSRQDRVDQKNDSMPLQLAKLGDFVRDSLDEAHSQLKESINLSYIGVRQAKVVLHSQSRGEGDVWLIPSFTFKYDQKHGNRLLGSGVVQKEAAKNTNAWFLLSHKQGDAFIDVETQLRNVVPAELSTLVPVMEALKPLRVGVTGQMQARLNLAEGIESGELSVTLSKGEIGLFGDGGPVFEVSNGAFDFVMQAGAKHIVMRNGELNYPSGRIVVKGDIWRENSRNVSPNWRFQLYSTEGEFFSDGKSVNKQKLDEFQFSGRLFAAAAPISIDEMHMRVGATHFIMAHDGSRGPASILRGKIKELPVGLLKLMWPKGFEVDSRKWIFENVKSGIIKSGAFALKAPGVEAGLVLSGEKRKKLKLPYVDLSLRDLGFMVLNDDTLLHSKIVKLKMRGKTLGVSSKLAVIRSRVGGAVKLETANIDIADYERSVPEARIKFSVSSDAATMLDIFKQKPFLYNSYFGESIRGLKGDIKGNVSISLPLKEQLFPKDIHYGGSFKLSGAGAEIGNFKITSGLVNFDVSDRFIQAKGNMLANGVSAQISWQRQLVGKKEKDAPIIISGQFDEADRNQLGIEVNHLVQGAVPVVVSISHGENQKLDMHVSADLTNARITAKALGWTKEKGRSSSLDFDILLDKKQKVFIDNFNIKGDDLTVRGSIEFDKNHYLSAFDFPAVSHKVVSNISLKGKLDKRNIWRVSATGPTYDGRGLLKSLLQTGRVGESSTRLSERSKGLDLNAKFDTVLGWQQSKVDGFKIAMKRRGDKMTSFYAGGTLPRGGELVAKKVSKQKDDTVIQVRTNDAGEALRFIGFYPNMLGGKGDLKVRYNDKKRQLASKTGLLSIRNFSIASDPVVKEVLANFASKKSNKNNGAHIQTQDRISFARLDAPFSIGEEQFVLHDSNVRGELLGATMRGRIDFRREQVRLGGTYIPLYGLNAAVGAVPVLGDILVGRQGEGILGITFGIYGSLRQPEVLVNPMSFVAPGVFRQIFEFEQGGQKIKARSEKTRKKTTQKLKQSASPVQRRKKGETKGKRVPETSASNVVRQKLE